MRDVMCKHMYFCALSCIHTHTCTHTHTHTHICSHSLCCLCYSSHHGCHGTLLYWIQVCYAFNVYTRTLADIPLRSLTHCMVTTFSTHTPYTHHPHHTHSLHTPHILTTTTHIHDLPHNNTHSPHTQHTLTTPTTHTHHTPHTPATHTHHTLTTCTHHTHHTHRCTIDKGYSRYFHVNKVDRVAAQVVQSHLHSITHSSITSHRAYVLIFVPPLRNFHSSISIHSFQ